MLVEGEREVHEDHFVGMLTKLPLEAHVIDEVLEVFPVLLVNLWVLVAEPDAKAVVDEAF